MTAPERPATPPQGGEKLEFQAEVQQLLDLMVHSLYSDRDVFLRELISNASDALDKLRFARQTEPDLAASDGVAQITLTVDAAARTLTIADNGIGMTRDEVVRNIGTIAKSGTREFLASAKAGDARTPELIGKFGVGFYAAFMVASRIELVTRRAGTDANAATRWESDGGGTYTIDASERAEHGTTITLHLKPLARPGAPGRAASANADAQSLDGDDALHDYTNDGVLSDIVKRYSDFVAYPIVLGDKTLNSQKAIWDRPKAEVTDQEYKDFYRHITHDWTDPLRTIPIKMEGTLEAYALLYVPERAPFDLYNPEMKRGVQLYVRRVFVMDECKELIPTYLRFVRGVVDAHDLSLNVSREILQKDRQLGVIRKQLVKKVLATLAEMQRDDAEAYLKFWAAFGPVLKEAFASAEGAPDRDKLLELVLAHSTRAGAGGGGDATKLTSLADYVSRMKPGQDAIYFLTGPSLEAAARSPLLESVIAKGYEVLLFTDPIDELWLEQAPKLGEHALVSIARGDVAVGSEDERKQSAAAIEDKQRELVGLLTQLRVHLQDTVKDVRLTSRLTSSPACLVADAHDLSPRMQRMFEQMGQTVPKAKPILELNPDHPLLAKLSAVAAADTRDARIQSFAQLLLGQAYLADSGQLPDPAAFATALADVMLRAV